MNFLYSAASAASKSAFEADLPPEGAPRASTSGSFLVTESSLHTRAFLAEKGVLDEIAPDLDACYAVGVSGSGVRYLTTSDSAVLQVIPGRGEFTANDYDYLKENVEASRRYYAENPDVLAADFSPGEDVELDEWGNAVVQAQMAGASEVLFEDPADIAALAAAALLAGLTACQSGSVTNNANTYVQGLLDASYLGEISTDYLKVTEYADREAAEADYESYMAQEAEDLLSYLIVSKPTQAVTQRAQEVIRAIYSHAQYTVAPAEELENGDVTVDVTISPMEFPSLLSDEELLEIRDQLYQAAGVRSDDTSGLTDEEYQALNEEYANALLDRIEAQLPQLVYGKSLTIPLQLENKGGYYSLEETGLQAVDLVMLDYSGQFA